MVAMAALMSFSLFLLPLLAVALPPQSQVLINVLPPRYPSRLSILHPNSLVRNPRYPSRLSILHPNSLVRNPSTLVHPRSLSRSTLPEARRFLRSLASSPPVTRKTPAHDNTSSPHPPTQAPPPPSPNKRKNVPKVAGWFSGIAVGSGAGALTALLLMFVSRVLFKWFRIKPSERTIIYQHKWLKAKDLAFLDKKDGLEGAEILGQGGSGKVYRVLLENGKEVAIKRVLPFVTDEGRSPNEVLEKSYDLTKNTKQTQAELRTLGTVRHRNLVTLLAYMPKADAHLLIYEFLENGSLRDALIKVADGSLILTWPMRHKIAIGIASGLKYLHCDCKPRIVHRDIKPGNILLDKEFEAHLGDFGLAKVFPDSFTHFTSENAVGTVGYMPPEHYQTLKYTIQGDIFSFGVVLIVLLIGKEPTAEMFSDVQTNMGDWVRDLMVSGREAVIDRFDSTLRNQGFEDETFLAFKLAAFCLDHSPASRPSSTDVLVMLCQIRSP